MDHTCVNSRTAGAHASVPGPGSVRIIAIDKEATMSFSQYASDALAERAVTGSVLERLAAVNPNTELWWDSSPLVFETWREQMLAAAGPDDRPALADELLRLWDPDRPAATLFRGVTTNPPLSLAALRDDPARWIAWLRTYRQSHPDADAEQAFWAVYKDVVRNGAAALMPLHAASALPLWARLRTRAICATRVRCSPRPWTSRASLPT
jgi:hypothetical protein